MTSFIRAYLGPSHYPPHASIATSTSTTLFLLLFKSPLSRNFKSTFLPILQTQPEKSSSLLPSLTHLHLECQIGHAMLFHGHLDESMNMQRNLPINTPQHVPAPEGNGILIIFQVANPIQHQFHRIPYVPLITLATQAFTDLLQHSVMLGQMHDEQDAKEDLGPGEEVGD